MTRWEALRQEAEGLISLRIATESRFSKRF
jgi:hypothetical protein